MKIIHKLFLEDQEERRKLFGVNGGEKITKKEAQQLEKNDEKRRKKSLGLIKSGKIKTRADFYHASMIFQHGEKPEHYKLANQLANKSMKLGYKKAKWLYAATLDRYLDRKSVV